MSRISERVKPFVVDEADAPLDGWDDPVKGRIRWRTLFRSEERRVGKECA